MTPPIGSMWTNDFIVIPYKGKNKCLLTCKVNQRHINYWKGPFFTHAGDDSESCSPWTLCPNDRQLHPRNFSFLPRKCLLLLNLGKGVYVLTLLGFLSFISFLTGRNFPPTLRKLIDTDHAKQSTSASLGLRIENFMAWPSPHFKAQ